MSGSQPEDRGSSPLGGIGLARKTPRVLRKPQIPRGFLCFVRDGARSVLRCNQQPIMTRDAS